MITIFSNPRPFSGPFELIQKNAINSWLALRPSVEIILFKDEENTSSAVAKEYGLKCISHTPCNVNGTPFFAPELEYVRKNAKFPIIAQINSDIILTSDFLKSIKVVQNILKEKQFFLVGQRWDLEQNELINFQDPYWEINIKGRAMKDGKLHASSAMDYWVFPKAFDFNTPPFVVGRVGMDSWLVFHARCRKIPVIDGTESIMVIHQNHNYPLKRKEFFQSEVQANIEASGGFSCHGSVLDSNWVLKAGKLRRPRLLRRLLVSLFLVYPWRRLLAYKRQLEFGGKKSYLMNFLRKIF